jgi:hypothetical protein
MAAEAWCTGGEVEGTAPGLGVVWRESSPSCHSSVHLEFLDDLCACELAPCQPHLNGCSTLPATAPPSGQAKIGKLDYPSKDPYPRDMRYRRFDQRPETLDWSPEAMRALITNDGTSCLPEHHKVRRPIWARGKVRRPRWVWNSTEEARHWAPCSALLADCPWAHMFLLPSSAFAECQDLTTSRSAGCLAATPALDPPAPKRCGNPEHPLPDLSLFPRGDILHAKR